MGARKGNLLKGGLTSAEKRKGRSEGEELGTFGVFNQELKNKKKERGKEPPQYPEAEKKNVLGERTGVAFERAGCTQNNRLSDKKKGKNRASAHGSRKAQWRPGPRRGELRVQGRDGLHRWASL